MRILLLVLSYIPIWYFCRLSLQSVPSVTLPEQAKLFGSSFGIIGINSTFDFVVSIEHNLHAN
jgi:hypothetical protein